MNLCTNAAHAMREKGGDLDIQVNNHRVSPSNGNPHEIKPGLYTRLTVRDTGTGMPPDILEKIFDPFFTTKDLSVNSCHLPPTDNRIGKMKGGPIAFSRLLVSDQRLSKPFERGLRRLHDPAPICRRVFVCASFLYSLVCGFAPAYRPAVLLLVRVQEPLSSLREGYDDRIEHHHELANVMSIRPGDDQR